VHAQRGIATEAWAPLGKGALLTHPPVTAVAEGRGRTPAQVLIRWHIQLGNIVIPKSVNPTRIASNFDVFDFVLSASNSAPTWRRYPRSMMGPGWVRILEPSISQTGE
jgi:2,5-diketo-D-gluconate reductase A